MSRLFKRLGDRVIPPSPPFFFLKEKEYGGKHYTNLSRVGERNNESLLCSKCCLVGRAMYSYKKQTIDTRKMLHRNLVSGQHEASSFFKNKKAKIQPRNKLCAMLHMYPGDSIFSTYPTAPSLSSHHMLGEELALAQHSNHSHS